MPDAGVGVPYEYHLYVHCGIRSTEFAGRSWVAAPPSDVPPSDAPIGSDQCLRGVMTLVSDDRARFEWPGGHAEFVPARSPSPLCA